jgi:hypothetical protein
MSGILLPYVEDMRGMRKGVLESYVGDSESGFGRISFKTAKQRHNMARRGHVKCDAEVMDQKPNGSAEKWKSAFLDISVY